MQTCQMLERRSSQRACSSSQRACSPSQRACSSSQRAWSPPPSRSACQRARASSRSSSQRARPSSRKSCRSLLQQTWRHRCSLQRVPRPRPCPQAFRLPSRLASQLASRPALRARACLPMAWPTASVPPPWPSRRVCSRSWLIPSSSARSVSLSPRAAVQIARPHGAGSVAAPPTSVKGTSVPPRESASTTVATPSAGFREGTSRRNFGEELRGGTSGTDPARVRQPVRRRRRPCGGTCRGVGGPGCRGSRGKDPAGGRRSRSGGSPRPSEGRGGRPRAAQR